MIQITSHYCLACDPDMIPMVYIILFAISVFNPKTLITNDWFGDNEDDNVELNKYKWVHPTSPLGLIYPTNAAILHREEKID